MWVCPLVAQPHQLRGNEDDEEQHLLQCEETRVGGGAIRIRVDHHDDEGEGEHHGGERAAVGHLAGDEHHEAGEEELARLLHRLKPVVVAVLGPKEAAAAREDRGGVRPDGAAAA